MYLKLVEIAIYVNSYNIFYFQTADNKMIYSSTNPRINQQRNLYIKCGKTPQCGERNGTKVYKVSREEIKVCNRIQNML